MTAPARIPQSEIERAVRGAITGGMDVGRVRVDLNARVIDIFSAAASRAEPVNPWDEVHAVE